MPQSVVSKIDLYAVQMAREAVTLTFAGGHYTPWLHACSVRNLKNGNMIVVGKLAGYCKFKFRAEITVSEYDADSGKLPESGSISTLIDYDNEHAPDWKMIYFRHQPGLYVTSFEFGLKPVQRKP